MSDKSDIRSITPKDLILRCYGRQIDQQKWYGVCLDLNLAVEAPSINELRVKMKEIISSYLETVLDTEDVNSVPDLLSRRAPVYDWIIYYYIAFMYHITHPPKNKLFNEFIPFHLTQNHC